MGDSDDDYDRKRRDKFRGERSVGADRRERRDDWVDRGRPKADYRDYRPPRERSSYSPGRDYPPMKRMRGDYDDSRARYAHDPYAAAYGVWGSGGGHEHYGMHHMGGGGGYGQMPREHPHRESNSSSDVQTQPCLMTLKQFLATQDDSISDSDAIEKYNEYKLEFKRQQLNEFFVAHKDEEWFKLKYHPEESVKRKEEQLGFLKKRVDVFVELLDSSTIASVSVDTNQSEKLLRVLDTVVIKLEGGTDEDINALDEKPVQTTGANSEETTIKTDSAASKAVPEEKPTDEEESAAKNDDSVANNGKKAKKRKHSGSSDSSSSSSTDSEANEKEDEAAAAAKPDEPPAASDETTNEEKATAEDGVEPGENMDVEGTKEKDGDAEDEGNPEKLKDDAGEEGSDEEKPEEPTEAVDLDKDKTEVGGGRALHKTSSIFLRNLAPTITKAEVEAVCRRYDGYLRVAIADPLVERRWFRRGWVSFRRDVNIKEICWNLNNIRLRDCELGAIVNRDLSRRVRPVNGITNHKTIIRNDIKVCAKIVHNLDEKYPLWVEDGDEAKGEEKVERRATFGFQSKNPVLQNITDYLIEEGSAEEDELLGLNGDDKEEAGVADENFERDSTLVSVLDKLVLYLRIVHSVDFYNHCEYPYEDEMPNRCGIVHARMPVPTTKATSQDVQDYIKNFEGKMEQFLQRNSAVPEEELKRLGCKDPEQEVEKFITANSQELAKDKWLCPLSGKKFKGPDFIRKHILNKHGEKVDEVRKEVEYFNNYLKDGKRPQLPEHPANSKKDGAVGGPKESPMMGGYRPPYHGPGFGSPYGGPYGPPPMGMHGRGRGPSGPRRPMPADFRPIIHYRDLDAPREPDEFL